MNDTDRARLCEALRIPPVARRQVEEEREGEDP